MIIVSPVSSMSVADAGSIIILPDVELRELPANLKLPVSIYAG